MKRSVVVLGLSAVVCLGIAAPAASTPTPPPVPAPAVSLTLLDVPATVPAGSESSVGAFVPKGASCRSVMRDAGSRIWKGPRAKATSGYMQFPWLQERGSAVGQWRIRVKCRTEVEQLKSRWASFAVTLTAANPQSVPDMEKPASASLSAVPQASGWAPFGTTLIKGSDWFGGHGIDVRSNGGNGCASNCAVRGLYGAKYQCVELVNRFVRAQGWVAENIMGNAGQILDKAPRSAFDKHPAGDGYVPVPGDIIVWTGGSTGYGHVAVVSAVQGRMVTFVEQNASRTGTWHLKQDSDGVLAPYGSLRHIGYLHAKANV